MGGYPFVLYVAGSEDFPEVAGLVREAADWLWRKGTDQWQKPWPDEAAHQRRIRDDLLKDKTRLLRDGESIVATITIDTDGPMAKDHQVWPSGKNSKPAVYVRRIVVSRRYAGRGLGAALLDWAAETAETEYRAELMRIDVWTTNETLHAYYEGQHFVRCQDPQGLGDYPSQALFERPVQVRGSSFLNLFITEDGQGARKSPC
jgi:GNAT superfamily N-acetyltransferase